MKKIKKTRSQKILMSAALGAAAACSASAYEVPLTFFGTNMPSLDFHGFASQGFLASSKYDYLGYTKSGSAKFTEAGVNVSMNPFARTHITAQGFLFDVGKVGEYQPSLDYASVDYSFSDAVGVRGGRIVRPEGIYNSIQSIDLARTSILLPQGMYDARYRDFSGAVDGGSLYGNVGLSKAGSLSYEAYGGMVSLADNGGIARRMQDNFRNAPTEYAGVNGFPQAGIQLWYNTPLEGLRVGAAFTEAFGFSYDYKVNIPVNYNGGYREAKLDSPAQHYSLEYQWKSWTFQAEYKYSQYLNNRTTLNGQPFSSSSDAAADTWYVGASYRAAKWLEVGAYYSEVYNNVDNRSGAGTAVPSDAYQKDAALSVRFDLKPWWIVKVEGHAINGTGEIFDAKNNPNRNSGEWFMVAVKTTLSF